MIAERKSITSLFRKAEACSGEEESVTETKAPNRNVARKLFIPAQGIARAAERHHALVRDLPCEIHIGQVFVSHKLRARALLSLSINESSKTQQGHGNECV